MTFVLIISTGRAEVFDVWEGCIYISTNHGLGCIHSATRYFWPKMFLPQDILGTRYFRSKIFWVIGISQDILGQDILGQDILGKRYFRSKIFWVNGISQDILGQDILGQDIFSRHHLSNYIY